MNQHLVSRVLLRRWATRPKWTIGCLNVDTLEYEEGGVDCFGGIKDLITEDARKQEDIWNNQVEKQLNHSFSLLDNGKILEAKHIAHLNALKRCLALHWARSFAVTTIVRQIQPIFVDGFIKDVLRSVSPSEALRQMTSLHVPDTQARGIFEKKAQQEFDKARPKVLKQVFEKNFERAKAEVADAGLEICTAKTGELVIGDCPVVTWNKKHNLAGPLNGITWNDAQAIFMPLGPRHVISLNKKSVYREINEVEVAQINKLQVHAAYREIYFVKGSSTGRAIAEALRVSSDTTPSQRTETEHPPQ